MLAPEPNPPPWPASVRVFSPTDSAASIQSAVDAVYARVGGRSPPCNGQFSSERHAFLFRSGVYANVTVPVGYYTQVLGLGEHPDDVTFTSAKGVYAEEGDTDPSVGALNNFWRGAENFASRASYGWSTGTGMLWAVSQAAPLRRVRIERDLVLYQYFPPYPNAGFASGGFLAASSVGGAVRARGRGRVAGDAVGNVIPGSQQQWFTRNSAISGWTGGLFNMVFVGVDGAPAAHCGAPDSLVSVEATPLVAEKPYVTESDGRFTLLVPQPARNTVGPAWASASEPPPRRIGFEQVYVSQCDASGCDSSATLNSKLAAGLHLVLSPGVYELDAPLVIATPEQVVLGLGLATLVACCGRPAVVVRDVDGVRLGGVLLQAGPKPTAALLQWGDAAAGGAAAPHRGDPSNPSFMHDVFARVGGPDTVPVQASVMVAVSSGHVVIDNMWLWRADHGAGGAIFRDGANPCETALHVRGDDVIAYGLAAEHALADLTVWEGERGRTYFYQSELPYDVTQTYGDSGYAGYRVGADVREHDAWGVGVYHFFRDHEVTVASGIVAPPGLAARFRAPLSLYLNGNGTVRHVINALGNETAPSGGPGHAEYVCTAREE